MEMEAVILHPAARVARQIEHANPGATAACRKKDSPKLVFLLCSVNVPGAPGAAQLEVMAVGIEGLYEITECRPPGQARYTQAPRGVCRRID
jgi:hypothetical protein